METTSSGSGGNNSSISGSGSCPTCHVAFDEGKRRCLTDACGHERCYSCMFRDEGCPICRSTHDLAGRSKVRTNGHFKSIQARFENIAVSGNHSQSADDDQPPPVLPRQPIVPQPSATQPSLCKPPPLPTEPPPTDDLTTNQPTNDEDQLERSQGQVTRSQFGDTSKPEIPRKMFLTSQSSPSLSTLDRVFKLEGYDDKPKNRRPVMGTSTHTKLYGPPNVTGPIVPSPVSQQSPRSTGSSRTLGLHDTPPPVPARQPKTSLSGASKKNTPPLPIPPRTAPRRQFSQPPPPPAEDGVDSEFGRKSDFNRNATFLPPKTDFSASFSGSSLGYKRGEHGEHVYASVEDIRKGVTSLMNRLRGENVMQTSFQGDSSSLFGSSLKENTTFKDPNYGAHQLRLNERGFLEQSGVRRKSAQSSQPLNIQPATNSSRQNSFSNQDTFGVGLGFNESFDSQTSSYSRSVPNHGYSIKNMSASTSALSGHASGQNTCDSGIGSEMNGSTERLAKGVSKCSLHSDTSMDMAGEAGHMFGVKGIAGSSRFTEHEATISEDIDGVEPPPPPPDVAQNDLMMRLGLLLGDRLPTSAPTTPQPEHASMAFPVSISTKNDVVSNAQFSPMMSPKWSGVPDGFNRDRHRGSFQKDVRGQGYMDNFAGMTSPDSPRSSCGPSPRMSNKFSSPAAQKERTPPRRDGTPKMAATSGMGSRDQSTESVTSLVSSGTNGPNTASPESTLSYHSNQSTPVPSMTSPTAQRPHSITTSAPGQVEELFGKRKSSVRRSARSNWTRPVQDNTASKVRFMPIKPPSILLKKLHFEVPHMENPSVFVGREWLFNQILQELQTGSSRSQGAVISGLSGSGKTAVVEQLVEHSFYGEGHTLLVKQKNMEKGRRTNRQPVPQPRSQSSNQPITASPLSSQKLSNNQSNLTSSPSAEFGNYDPLMTLAECVVGYHICQADNNITCMVPEFIHSIAAYLSSSPLLTAYRDILLQEPHLQPILSIKQCIEDPSRAFIQGILEPLIQLKNGGLISTDMCIIVVDSLNEAEFHKPDYGDSISSFLARHIGFFPPWLKCIVTVNSQLEDITKALPFSRLSLDPMNELNLVKIASDTSSRHEHDNCIIDDLNEYVMYRINNSQTMSDNLALSGKKPGSSPDQKAREKFLCFVQNHAQGNVLYTKLLLNLIEGGSLVLKSSNFQILPPCLTDIFLLMFNLKFPTIRSFEKIVAILNICIATLYPLTKQEIFEAINSNFVRNFVDSAEFSQRILALADFLWPRRDGTFVFFHPAFRDWLLRREDGEREKFVCQVRNGHCLLAFKLSRADRPLSADKTLELGHHILKAHIYKHVSRQLGYSAKLTQAHWVATCSRDLNAALTSMHNVFSPNIKVSRLILVAGANPNTPTEFLHHAPALCVAAREGLGEFVSLLLEFGANVNATGEDGMCALSYASQRGHVHIMRQLVDFRARINQMDVNGFSPAVHAARFGQIDALNVLLQCDWTVYRDKQPIRNEVMQQSLVVSASAGHAQICDFLLNLKSAAGGGFDINFTDTLYGETALTAAILSSHTQTVHNLLERGAAVDVCNAKGQPPSICAAKAGHWEGLELIMQRGAVLEMCDRQQRTALMVAAAEGQTTVLDLLLSQGSSVTLTDRDGLTALSWACYRAHLPCVQALLDQGAQLEHLDRSGRTPLDLACLTGDAQTVQQLLERGANMERTDSSGMRALDRAIGARHTAVVMCFLRKGAKLGPATWAMAQGKSDILSLLLNKLMEDGNILYKKNRIKDAAHRYQYALKKFPVDGFGDDLRTFKELKVNLMLNLSRCKRKTNEFSTSIELATKALDMKPKSYEAFYARARAYRDVREYGLALKDLQYAMKIAPENQELQRLLARVQGEQETLSKMVTVGNSNMAAGDFRVTSPTVSESSTSSLVKLESGVDSKVPNHAAAEREKQVPSILESPTSGSSNSGGIPHSNSSGGIPKLRNSGETHQQNGGVPLTERKREETDL